MNKKSIRRHSQDKKKILVSKKEGVSVAPVSPGLELSILEVTDTETASEKVFSMPEPSIHLDLAKIDDMLKKVVNLEHEVSKCERVINGMAVAAFDASVIGLQDVSVQVETVRAELVNLNTFSGVTSKMKDFGASMTFKNPTTGYRQQLDVRLGSVLNILADELIGRFAKEYKLVNGPLSKN